jgi:hypothetical protein
LRDQLQVINVVRSRDRLLLQTVCSNEPDQLGGVRRTDIEVIASPVVSQFEQFKVRHYRLPGAVDE